MRAAGSHFALLLAVALASAPVAAEDAAAGDAKSQCARSYEHAQELRQDGKLVAARAEIVICARECPGEILAECSRWLSDVDRSLPSVVVAATDANGNDVRDVRVSVDGQPLLAILDGHAVQVDPGPRRFRFERTGSPAIDREILVQQGEKDRLIRVAFAATAASARPRTAVSTDGAGPSLVPPLVLGGIGVLALGSFAFFAATAKRDIDDLRASCAPSCVRGDVDSARTKLLVADISLGVGVVSLGVATWLLLSRDGGRPTSPAAASVDLRPLPGGGALSVRGAF